MDNPQNDYQSKYTELQLLGRGNYGSAYVVKSKEDEKLYVAKKMNLDGMNQGQVQAAKQQIKILKKFSQTNDYPFIVKYKQSFYFERTLVIVMEYCQCGDLATFIKMAKKKNQLLDQKVIVAWFLMLLIGIKALHLQNVLHRDLKSANVFLTANKYVKIGDFGISKVLDSTSAKTFVGTPYYLSPQVCSNKKYDLRSDLWSLGCILYQLCTLNYPFQANNILSLAMKITSQQAPPIPSKYSKELSQIVSGLLTKDQNKRISIQQILQMPYMIKFMQQNSNRINQIVETVPLKKTLKIQGQKQQSTIRDKNQSTTSNNQDTMKTIKSNFQKTSNNQMTMTANKSMKQDTLDYSMTGMSPKQLMNKRKQQRIRQEEQMLRQHHRNKMADQNEVNFAKTKKLAQLGGSGSNFSKVSQQGQTLHKKYQKQNQQRAQEKYQQKCRLNDKQAINLKQLKQACDLTLKMGGVTISNSSTVQKPIDLTASMEQKLIAANKNYQAYTKTVQQQPQDQELQQYYDQQFESYQNQQQKANIENQNDIFKSCLKVYAGQKQQISPSKLASVEKLFQKKSVLVKSDQQKKQQCIKQCIALVNSERYKLLYDMVSQGYKGGKYSETPALKKLRVTGSNSQKQALRLIDLIKYYQTLTQ